jgi:hypothetical protein
MVSMFASILKVEGFNFTIGLCVVNNGKLTNFFFYLVL